MNDFSIIEVTEKTLATKNLWTIVFGKVVVSIIGLNVISNPRAFGVGQSALQVYGQDNRNKTRWGWLVEMVEVGGWRVKRDARV